MSISGIYASFTQISENQLGTGYVDIGIQTYKLNNENIEILYDDKKEKTVFPSSIISFIPKIKNSGENCYLRVKIFYINNDINAENYILGISNDWEKNENYFYYKKILKSKESAKLFDTITIPKNINEITTDKKIKLIITAEAIQEKIFVPDYTKNNPWYNITAEKIINTKYDINPNGSKKDIIINYENKTNDDIEISNDFLSGMAKIMPGDIYTSSIKLSNSSKNNAEYYFKISLDNAIDNENLQSLLNELKLILTNQFDEIIYNGKLGSENKISLGKYNIGQNDKINFKILVPNELSNKYTNLYPNIFCTFSVDYDKEDQKFNNSKIENSISNISPQTGDKISKSMAIFFISAISLIILIILDYLEIKKENY